MASMPKFYDMVMETTTTTGTGTLTLLGAVTGYRSFATLGNGNSACFMIQAVDGSGVPTGEWEVSQGTYTSSGTTLSRTLFMASSTGSAVSFAAATKRVFIVLPAAFINPPASVVTTDTTVLSTHGPLCVDATSGNLTITLQAAALRGGAPVKVMKLDTSANTVTIARVGSDLIGGATSLVLSGQYAAALLHSDGISNYYQF